jgi:deoxyribonuclease-1
MAWLLVFILFASEAEAKNCRKGIPCGNTCISANKRCRSGQPKASQRTPRQEPAQPAPSPPQPTPPPKRAAQQAEAPAPQAVRPRPAQDGSGTICCALSAILLSAFVMIFAYRGKP